MLLAK